MLLYFFKIDFFFLQFIYSPVKRAKSKEQRAKSKERKARRAKSNDDVQSLRAQPSPRAQHLRLAKRAHCYDC